MEKSPLEKKAEFDDIWNELPHCGNYQLRLVCFSSYLTLIMGISALYPVFAQYEPTHHCRSELDDLTNLTLGVTIDNVHNLSIALQQQCSPDNSLHAKVGCQKCSYSAETFSACQNINTATNMNTMYECLVNSKELGTLESCGADGHTYLRHRLGAITNSWESAVTTFDLVCEGELMNTWMTAAGSFGFLLGSLLAGVHCDTFGRKNSMVVHTFTTSITLVLHGLIVNRYAFIILRCLGAMFSIIGFLSALTYGVEILGPTRRSVPSTILCFMFAGGFAGLSVLAYVLPDWQHMTLGFAALTIINVVFLPFIPESPRFLVSKGRYEEAQAILETIARKSNKGTPLLLPDISLYMMVPTTKVPPTSSMFKSKFYRKVTLILSLAYAASTLVYYGLSYGVSTLSGSIYINNSINGALEAIAYCFTSPAIEMFGRRITLVLLFIASGIACLGHMIVIVIGSHSNITAFVGKFCISGVFCALFTYSAELYPTELRSLGIGLTSMVGRLGSISAPFLLMLITQPGFQWVPHTIFASLSIVTGFAILALPETKSLPLFQSVNEAEQFHMGRERNSAE